MMFSLFSTFVGSIMRFFSLVILSGVRCVLVTLHMDR